MGELHRTWGNKSHSQDLKTGWSREDNEPVQNTKENANNAKILGAAEEQEHKLPPMHHARAPTRHTKIMPGVIGILTVVDDATHTPLLAVRTP